MEKIIIRSAENPDYDLAEKISGLIKEEADKCNMLHKGPEEVFFQMGQGDSIIALRKTEVVGYVDLGRWPDYVEIRSLVVRKDLRKHGIGTGLVSAVVFFACRKYRGKEVIAIAKPMSRKIFIGQGFAPVEKKTLKDYLWEPCATDRCVYLQDFPDCQCVALVLK